MKTSALSMITMVMFLSSGASAFAHAHLQTQKPAADTVVVASPESLSLGFSERLEISFSGVTLKGLDGKPIPTGAPMLTPADDKQMRVPLRSPLGTGKYTVEWHVLSKDGHTSQGSYQFTVEP